MPVHHRLCANPLLLREEVRRALREQVQDDEKALNFLAQADSVAPQILERRLPYVLGIAPIELVAQQVAEGSLTMDDGLERARWAGVVDQLLPIYVKSLGTHATNISRQNEWRAALRFLRLLRAALEAAERSAESIGNLNFVESAFAEAAIWSLVEVPDRRLLDEAEQCALRVVDRTDPSQGDEHGLALMRLGVMHLDPYVKFRDLGNYRAAFDLWHGAFSREYGASAARIPRKEWQMPPIEDALRKAAGYLRRASDARKGRLRGLSLKALAEALDASALVSGRKLGKEAEKAAREALGLLDPREIDHIESLKALLRRRGKSDIDAPRPADESILEGMQQPAFIYGKAERLKDLDPRAALEMLRDARGIFDRYAYEQQQQQRLNLMAALLRQAIAPAEDPSRWGKTWEDKLRYLKQRVQGRKLGGPALAACALQLAVDARSENAEQRALPLVQLAVEADPALAKEYDEVFRFVSYQLYNGAGVNCFNDRNFGNAVTAYLAALGASLSLPLKNSTLDLLEKVNDSLAKAEKIPFPDHALELLASNWLECEKRLEETGALQLVEIAAQLDRSLESDSQDDFQTAWLLWQVAKGFRFACSLSAPTSGMPDVEVKLLEEIARVERLIGQAEPAVDDEPFLTSWLRPKASGQGDTDKVRLANLQHAFDVAREKRLSESKEKPRFLAVADAMEHVGPDTALVPLFLGEAPDRNLAVRWACLFGGSGSATRISYPIGHAPEIVDQGGFELIVPPLAELIGSARALIRADPGFDVVNPEAAAILATWEAGLTGRLRQLITANRQIKHVCFWPHGPLHFMPLHLLGSAHSLLADLVTVTYTPSMALLAREKAPLRDGIFSLGLGFQSTNTRDLAPLSDAPAEAAEIANLFGTKAVPEAQATPRRLLEALPTHRYVHIATHGSQNALAPSFHNLVLQPDPEGEDRLFAHNIDGLDLSGLDLITLSACESALGRVDPSDNLRGLAASLFRAGARTIVGTLWPTGSKVCRTFFVSLYRQLSRGATKRTAFTVAQKETRAIHAQHRAWGSFYMMGDWH